MTPNASPWRFLVYPATCLLFVLTLILAFTLHATTSPVWAQSDPGEEETPTQVADSYEYTVQPGDTWSAVANRTGVTVAVLQDANPRSTRRGYLVEGERLSIPQQITTIVHAVQPRESWSTIAKAYGITTQFLKATNPRTVRLNDVLYRGETLVIVLATDAETPAREPVPDPSGAETPEATNVDETTDTDTAAENTEAEESTDVNVDTAQTDGETEPAADETGAEEAEASVAGDDDQKGVQDDEQDSDNAADVADDPSTAEVTDETLQTDGIACPTEVDAYPATMIDFLVTQENSAEALSTFLTDCGVMTAGTVATQELTGDGQDDYVVVYGQDVAHRDDATADAVQASMDLVILNSDADGYRVGFQARAESEVQLLSTLDVNSDALADVAWIETTCGAVDCFQTMQIYSWDGGTWRNWVAAKSTIANADVRLEDIREDGQGFEFIQDGGVYAGEGAGPQRLRQEVWGSVDGAPYTLLEETVAETNCLYHLVLEANGAFEAGANDDLSAAELLYTQAISDPALVACGERANELDELRSFSTYRLALIAAYRGEPEVAGDLIATLGDSYPASIYIEGGEVWLAAYRENYDITAGCSAMTTFAKANRAAVDVLADYGYANPDFTAEEICPLLEIDVPTPEPTVAITDPAADSETTNESAVQDGTAAVAERATTTATADTAEAAVLGCPETLADYAETLPDLLDNSAGDNAAVEAWLRSCDALNDERGGFRLTNLNDDDFPDAIFLPTIVSDLGFGRDGAQGAVLIYHGTDAGSYELVGNPEIYGQPTLLTVGDLNDDERTDIAWTVEGCSSSFCVLEAQVITWADGIYTSLIEPGATIAEGTASFYVTAGGYGSGQQLVLEGGVSGAADGGLAVPHTEVWQSIDGAPFQRINWTYDRDVEGSNCLGLRLVEANVALQASAVIGYDPAIQLYSESIDPTLEACSVYGMTADDELQLLQGLASFRLIQAQALSGDFVAAGQVLQGLTQGLPDSDYTQAAETWLTTYEEQVDPAAACEAIQSIFEENEELWQITDHYGYNHPPLAAEQICYVP